MESNGKQVDERKLAQAGTGSGYLGSWAHNGHAFYQLIHQGTFLVPCDFIAPAISHNQIGDHHTKLLSNYFAQTEALMNGKTATEVAVDLSDMGWHRRASLIPFKVFEGNRPTNSFLVKKITPLLLGSSSLYMSIKFLCRV